jgi:hypothetical protein
MKAPLDSHLIRILVTQNCPKSCSNCQDLAPYAPKDHFMGLDRFAQSVDSLRKWMRPGRVLGVAGGEPTLHPEFEELSLSLQEQLNLPNRTNSRTPIADLNDLALGRLMERDGVVGLWTSLGEGFYRHYETILDVYGHVNIETHGSGKRHQAVMIDRGDYGAVTGQSDEQWLANRDACPTQRAFGPAINDRGAYFCGVAASLDRLLFAGAHAWAPEHDWWKRKVKDFDRQLTLCDYCALAQSVPAQVDKLERDILGRSAQARLAPLAPTQKYELFSPIHRVGSQVLNDHPFAQGATLRVEPGHASIKPRKLSCVLVSVGYGQALAETLPHNRPLFDQIVVVTTPEDETSRRVAEECGATLVLSRRCFDDDHAFNKGRMLNDGLAALDDPDWVVFTDADILMSDSLRAFVMGNALNPGCLYFTGRKDRTAVFSQHEDANLEPNGYFQLFHPRARSIRHFWPKLVSEEFCSAGSVDSWFFQQWPVNKLILVPELRVEHISSRWLAENWNGIGSKKGRWCQLGLMTVRGLISFRPVKTLPPMLRLTDTIKGEVTMVTPENFYNHVQRTDQGLVYNGRLLGKKHVHIAYFSEAEEEEPMEMPQS